MKTLDAQHYLISLSLRRDTDTEHYAVTREFLNRHETMLKDLLGG